jgi:hypothetical protein
VIDASFYAAVNALDRAKIEDMARNYQNAWKEAN